MKQILMQISVVILAGCLYAHAAFAGIAGTPHDFSGETWSNGELCVPCHTPHNANNDVTGAPLWNHAMPEVTYTLYSSSTLKETPDQPGPESLVCLSCHDGTVALDKFADRPGTVFLTGADEEYIGTTLADDHPVGILWSHKGSANCANCHFAGASEELPFYNGKVECATCHDPHDGLEGESFLRITAASSQICLHCHGK